MSSPRPQTLKTEASRINKEDQSRSKREGERGGDREREKGREGGREMNRAREGGREREREEI